LPDYLHFRLAKTGGFVVFKHIISLDNGRENSISFSWQIIAVAISHFLVYRAGNLDYRNRRKLERMALCHFFGFGTVVAVINLLPGRSYLRLTDEGFEVSSLSRKYFLHWTDVQHFGVAYVGLNKMVVFNFASPYVKEKMGRSISRQIAGWEGGLHDTFGMKAENLAALMNTHLISTRSHDSQDGWS
jgi:hypothetical protein